MTPPTSPNIRHYSHITYGNIAADDLQRRRSSSYKNNCLVFIFDKGAPISYAQGWVLLQTHFKQLEKMYKYSIDAMRQISKCRSADHDQPLIIEAHFNFLRYSPQKPTPTVFPKEPQASSRLLAEHTFNDGRIQLLNDKGERSNYSVTVRSTLPKEPIYRVYKLSNLPIGNPRHVRDDIRVAIRDALRLSNCEKNQGELPMDVVVDVVEGYTAVENSNGGVEMPLFNGTFFIIIDTSFLHPEASPSIKFTLYDSTQIYVMNNPTQHYLYCTRCKSLDSHVLFEKTSCVPTWREDTLS